MKRQVTTAMAYEYLKRDYQLNDSIRSERIRTRVAELDMRYRQDTIVLRKEMQIQRQAGEVRVLKLSMYIWVLVCLLLAAGTVVIIWYMRKKREFLRERFFQQINRVPYGEFAEPDFSPFHFQCAGA